LELWVRKRQPLIIREQNRALTGTLPGRPGRNWGQKLKSGKNVLASGADLFWTLNGKVLLKGVCLSGAEDDLRREERQ